jgi:hypothetical protein
VIDKNHAIEIDGSRFIKYRKCNGTGHFAKNYKVKQPLGYRRCLDNNDVERAVGHNARECPFYSRPYDRCLRNDDARRFEQPHYTKDYLFYKHYISKIRCKECGTFSHYRKDCPNVTCRRCNIRRHTEVACL